MPKQFTTNVGEEVGKIMRQPVGISPDEFMAFFAMLMPDRVDILTGHPVFTAPRGQTVSSLPWVSDDSIDLRPLAPGTDENMMTEDFGNAVREAEEAFIQRTGAGDEDLKAYANAVVFHPAKRALKGWPFARLASRLNIACWNKELGAYLNLGTDEKSREQLAYSDAHFPVNRVVVAADNVVQIHTDYFDAAEKGELNDDQVRVFRQRLLEEESRLLVNLERINSIKDPAEGKRIKELTGIGNEAQEFNRHARRGLALTTADTEARITGLKKGWPIEDLNVLSTYKVMMEVLYNSTHYKPSMNPVLRKTPEFKDGEEEYLLKMQRLWAKIEDTAVADDAARRALLTEMREVMLEGTEKEFLPTKKLSKEVPAFSYAIYDIDRKLERQLSPAELAVMTDGTPYNEAHLAFAVELEKEESRRRREEYEARQQSAREEEELRKAVEEQERLAEEERALREYLEEPDPRRYDLIAEKARQRRQEALPEEEIRRRREEIDPVGRIWFYDYLKEKRLQARKNAPINMSERPPSDQNDILRYYMGKGGLTFDQALDMQLLSEEERLTCATDYYDDLIAHPFVGVSPEVAEKNARYFGEMDAAAVKKLLAEPLPVMDLTDPKQIENFSSSTMGRRIAFVMDYMRNHKCFREQENPSSNVRRGYVEAFGSREQFARMTGQLQIYNTLGEIAIVAGDKRLTLLQRAVALHFLQTQYAELARKPLSELKSDAWIDCRARANAIFAFIRNDNFPRNGAPTERDLELFLAGKGPSPFNDAYLKQFDPAIGEIREEMNDRHSDVFRKRKSSIDLARIYNLDYISQRGAQPPFGPEGLDRLTPEQIALTHRIFEQTLGNHIAMTDLQSLLADRAGESVMDRFSVGGVKTTDLLKQIYGTRYDGMSAGERELAAEAELMRALADPAAEVKFTPFEYDRNGNIVEGTPLVIGRPAPQKTAAEPEDPLTDADRFERNVQWAEQEAQKFGAVAPGAYPVFAPGHLNQALSAAPDEAQEVKRSFMTDYSQAARALAERIAGENPQFAAYLRLQANIAVRSMTDPMPQEPLPFRSLMDLVDEIHLPLPMVIDERQPETVFRLITDEPRGIDPFPILQAAQSAERLIQQSISIIDSRKRSGQNAKPADDIAAREQMLREIAVLEGHLSEMERVAGLKKRGPQLAQAFEDPLRVGRFMTGNPGLLSMRAELQGRRTAIMQGWPAEDLDLIAGFYARRDTIRRALETMPAGTDLTMAYERAGKVLDEICRTLDVTTVDSAEKRQELLSAIDSYGDALYNNIISQAIGSERGRTKELRSQVQRARNTQFPAAAYRQAEELASLAEADERYRETERQQAEERARTRRDKIRAEREQVRREREQARQQQKQQQQQQQQQPQARPDWLEENRPAREENDLIDQVLEGHDPDAERFLEEEQDNALGAQMDAMVRDLVPDAYDPNDWGSVSFDEAFATEEERKGDDLPDEQETIGYYEWPDIKERLNTVASQAVPDLSIKMDRLRSVTNDMRAYFMYRNKISFADAYSHSEWSEAARRWEANTYLDELEAHPINKNITPDRRAESAAFYGEVHRAALERFLDSTYPEIDLSDREAMKRLGFGPSMPCTLGLFATDLSQDAKQLYLSDYPEVRSAYIKALGGQENYDRLYDRLSLMQSVSMLGQIAAKEPSEFAPVRNCAFAKLYLEMAQARMGGKKLSEMPEGMSSFLTQVGNYLMGGPIDEEGAPSEQELKDYLDGRIPSPFSDAYIERLNAAISEKIAADSRDVAADDVADILGKDLEEAGAVYDLPFIPLGPEVPRRYPNTDLMTLSNQELQEAHLTFDRIFNGLFNKQSNGQVRLARMRGETILDRFRLDGKRISEIPELAEAKSVMSAEEFRLFSEALILYTMADPNRTVSYVPLATGIDGAPVETEPVNVQKPVMKAFPRKQVDPEPAVVAGPESFKILKYTTGYRKIMVDLTDYNGLYPGDALLSCAEHQKKLDDPMFYSAGEGEPDEEEMSIGTGSYTDFDHIGGSVNGYALLKGLKADGTLTAQGQQNLKKLTGQMNALYDRVKETAAEWDAVDPMLAEMLRYKADYVATDERGTTWVDLKKNYAYQNLTTQLSGLHVAEPNAKVPYGQLESMRRIQGYPTGVPKFTLPQAISATRRSALTEAAHIRSAQRGTLTKEQDRMNRRLLLTEIEEAEKQLRRIDALYRSALDENGERDITKPGNAHVAYLDLFLENDVCHASSYFDRGTKYVHTDFAAKRRLLSNGWPVEDINLLARLYVRRAEIMGNLTSRMMREALSPEEVEELTRAHRVLTEICQDLENREIHGADDRERALAHIDSYGALLYNDTVMESAQHLHAYQTQFGEMRRRRPAELEYLSEEEFVEYRNAYNRFIAQSGHPDLKPTMNAPQTEEERAFLNAEHLSRLYEALGQMDADPRIAGDETLSKARQWMRTCATGVENFYKNAALLDPAHGAERKREFEDLLRSSTKLADALEEAEDKITKNGGKTRFNAAEEKTLREIRQARYAVGEMRRMYNAQVEYELMRRDDLLAANRAEESRLAAEARAQEEAERVLGEEAAEDYADTQLVLLTLPENERERLIRLLTEPHPSAERFDFNTGTVIPGPVRDLPERIRMDHDQYGRYRPKVLIDEDMLEGKDEIIRESRARRRAARTNFFPDESGAVDLFALADEDRRAEELKRAQSRAQETGDERYTWSFEQILDDAAAKRQTAKKAWNDAKEVPGIPQDVLTAQGLAAVNREKEYSEMIDTILAGFGQDHLEEEIEKSSPTFYRETIKPLIDAGVENLADFLKERPDSRSKICKRVMKNLSGEEKHRILGALADGLSPERREELRERLLSVKAPIDRPYEEQVTRPLAGRIGELQALQLPSDTNGIPLPPGERDAYRHVLSYAAQTLDEADPDVIQYVDDRNQEWDQAYQTVRNHQFDTILKEGDDDFRILSNRLLKGEDGPVLFGVAPEQERMLEETIHPQLQLSQEYLTHVGEFLRRMEELGITAGDQAEEGDKAYAFRGLMVAKIRLKEAIEKGDPQEIIRTGQIYEQKREAMRELMAFAKEHFSAISAPGNVDSIRNPYVPWEFSRERIASSQVNGLYQLYSALKRSGISIQEYVNDPNAAHTKMYEKLDEQFSLKTRMNGKTMGSALGELMAERSGNMDHVQGDASWAGAVIGRATEVVVESNPDLTVQGANRLADLKATNYYTSVIRVRERARNPFLIQDEARESQVLQLLNVVSEEDLAANYDRMLDGRYYDAHGHLGQTITAEKYIAGKREIDYMQIVNRGADIIRDAAAVKKTRFNAAAFMEERQRALSMLLTARPEDAGKIGFEMLEYEIMHAAELYDMLRAAMPDRQLPALTREQRDRMTAAARTYEDKKKRLQSGLSQQRRNEITRRRRNIRNIGQRVRTNLMQRQNSLNTQETAARTLAEQTRRDEEAARASQENLRLARERIRQTQEAIQAEARRKKEVSDRIAAHAGIPLAGRLERSFEALRQARQSQAMHGEDIDARSGRIIQYNDAKEKSEALFKSVLGAAAKLGYPDGMSKAKMEELLTREVGAAQAMTIAGKLPASVRNMTDLEALTAEERGILFGAIAAGIDPKERDRIAAADDAYVPFSQWDFRGSPYTEGLKKTVRARIRTSFDRQMNPNGPNELSIRALKSEIQNNYGLPRRQRTEVLSFLDESALFMRSVSPEYRERLQELVNLKSQARNYRRKNLQKKQLTRPENHYITELTERTGSGSSERPRKGKEADIQRFKNEEYRFADGYIASVAGVLRKMQEMKLLRSDGAAEDKAYAFRQVVEAQKELMAAVRDKDLERIRTAAANLKKVRGQMDELMQIAREKFHRVDYMDGLEVVRNREIPWDYARDVVPSSQINGFYELGNTLLRNGISIDEFERDPNTAIRKIQQNHMEQMTMKSCLGGKSIGTLAAQAATRFVEGDLQNTHAIHCGSFLRGIGSLVASDPGASHGTHERNLMLFEQARLFNTNVNQHKIDTSRLLRQGFDMSTVKGYEALRQMMLLEEKDLDPDRMFTDPPMGADGSLQKPFLLSRYLRRKESFDYQAQAGRLETILADAAKEADRLSALAEDNRKNRVNDPTMARYRKEGFRPFRMIRARQEALMLLLVLRANEKGKPGYQALEQELRKLPERYEALRKSQPALQLPALTREEQKTLKDGAALYDSLSRGKEKTLAAEENRIIATEKQKDKDFRDDLKAIDRTIRQRLQTLEHRMENQANGERTVAAIEAAETAYAEAVERRMAKLRSRARTILADYREGKIPQAYAEARLKQLREIAAGGAVPTQMPPLFGESRQTSVAERIRQEQRDLFLSCHVLDGRRFHAQPGQPDLTDTMLVCLDELGVPMQPQEAPLAPGPQAAQNVQQNVQQAQPVPQGQQNVQQAQPVPQGQQNVQQAQPVPQGQPPQQAGPKPPMHQAPIRRTLSGVYDTSFAALEKQLLGDKVEPAPRQRKGSVTSMKQPQPEGKEPVQKRGQHGQ